MNEYASVEKEPYVLSPECSAPEPTTSAEYAKAFAVNFAPFALAIGVYVLFAPNRPIQVIVLTLLSLYMTVGRVALIRVVERRFQIKDRELLLTIIDDNLKHRDRWSQTYTSQTQQCYQANLRIGFYMLRTVLVLTFEEDHLILCGHERIVRPVQAEIVRIGVATPVK